MFWFFLEKIFQTSVIRTSFEHVLNRKFQELGRRLGPTRYMQKSQGPLSLRPRSWGIDLAHRKESSEKYFLSLKKSTSGGVSNPHFCVECGTVTLKALFILWLDPNGPKTMLLSSGTL